MNIDLRDANVKFKMGHFMKSFVLHTIYMIGFGPFTNILTCFGFVDRLYMDNLGFGFDITVFRFFAFQNFLWLVTLSLPMILIIRCL